MPRQFGELIKTRSYLDLKSKELPTLQRRIYTVLRELTTSQLDFLLANDYPKLAVNNTRVDQDTHYIICGVLRELTEERNLLLTTDDLLCAWQRLKELIFLKQAVKQGIIRERPNDDGSVNYWCEDLPPEPVLRNVSDEMTLITVETHRPKVQVWRR